MQKQFASIRLEDEGFNLDREWSPGEYRAYQSQIEQHKANGYYHRVRIQDRAGNILETPGSHPSAAVIKLLDKVGFPQRLDGKSVLDIGCNTGFYSVVSKMRGATRVVGVDHQQDYINQAVMLRSMLDLNEEDVAFQVADGHDLSADHEQFDFVINTGVVYHLQNPMDFLSRMASVTREMMFLESEMLIDPTCEEHAWFIEGAYGGDQSNWWIYGPKCLERMARAAGFSSVDFKGFIWKPTKGTQTPEGYPRQGRGVLLCRK